MTILVIEDSRFLRLALDRILVKAGYHVIAVGDGREGLLRVGSPQFVRYSIGGLANGFLHRVVQ